MMKVKTFLLPLYIAVLVIAIGCRDIKITVQTKQPSVKVKVNEELKLTTDANGAGAIEMQRPKDTNSLSIEFEKEGYKPKVVLLELTKEKEYSIGPIELEEIIRKLTIRAFKVSEVSSECSGIESAKIIISIDDESPRTEKTGPTGSVTIHAPLKAKKAMLTVEHSEPNWFISDNDKQKAISLEPGKEEYFVEFLFQERRKRTISVKCVDENGQPVQGVSIKVAGENLLNVASDKKGEASISVNRIAGESVLLNFSHADFFSKDETVEIKKGVDKYPLRDTLRVVLDPKLYVSGRVLNERDVGVSGVRVLADGDSLGTSNESGNLPQMVRRRAPVQIQVVEPYLLIKSSIRPTNARRYFVDLTVEKPGPRQITIKTVDAATKNPIGEAYAYVLSKGSYRPAGATNDDGKVTVTVSDVSETIELRKHGYRTATVSTQNERQTVLLQKAKVKVFLDVHDETGKSIEQINVYVDKNQPLLLKEFQGKEFDLGNYELQVSPLTNVEEYKKDKKRTMRVEDDDGDGNFTFKVTLVEDLIERAKAAERAGNYAEAAQLYAQVSDKDPEHLSAWWRAGQIYGDKKNYNKAVEMFDKIIKEDRTHALAYYNKGVYYYLAKKYPDAVKAFDNVITYQKNLGDVNQYNDIMYKNLFYLADACDKSSKEPTLTLEQKEYYQNKAKHHCQEFKDFQKNVSDSHKNREEYNKRIDQILR